MALNNEKDPFFIVDDTVKRADARINAYKGAIKDLESRNNPQYKDFINYYQKEVKTLYEQSNYARQIVEKIKKNNETPTLNKNAFLRDQLSRKEKYQNLKQTRDDIPATIEDIRIANSRLIAVSEGKMDKLTALNTSITNYEHPFAVADDIITKANARITAYKGAINALKAKDNPKYNKFIESYNSEIKELENQKWFAESINSERTSNLKAPDGVALNNSLATNIYNSVHYKTLKQTRDAIPSTTQDITDSNAMVIAVTEGVIDKNTAIRQIVNPKPLSQQLSEEEKKIDNQIKNYRVPRQTKDANPQTNNPSEASSTTSSEQSVAQSTVSSRQSDNHSVASSSTTRQQSVAQSTASSQHTNSQKKASPKATTQNAQNKRLNNLRNLWNRAAKAISTKKQKNDTNKRNTHKDETRTTPPIQSSFKLLGTDTNAIGTFKFNKIIFSTNQDIIPSVKPTENEDGTKQNSNESITKKNSTYPTIYTPRNSQDTADKPKVVVNPNNTGANQGITIPERTTSRNHGMTPRINRH